jgi:hypothetical protein
MSNADLVRRFTEEFKNRSNFAIVDELFADNFVHHLPIPDIPPGRDGMKGTQQVRHWRHPRHQRDNGQEITWTEHEIWRAGNGRLAELWSVRCLRLDLG